MRTPCQTTASRLNLFQRDLYAALLQCLHKFGVALTPLGALFRQPSMKTTRWLTAGKINKHVNEARLGRSRQHQPRVQFYASHQVKSSRFGNRQRRIITVEGIVVGNGQRRQLFTARQSDKFRRRKGAIRRVRVRMQINKTKQGFGRLWH